MKKYIKNTGIKLSLVVAMVATPSVALAASGAGVVEGSSESTSAGFESPNFEGQIARINIGINFIRLNTDILKRMPVSEDAEWVDKLVSFSSLGSVHKSKSLREDPYYSTVGLTNYILHRAAVSVTPLTARLFYEAGVIYKNEANGYQSKDENGNNILDEKGYLTSEFKTPNMNVFPDISDMTTYVTFQDEKGVAPIDVEAKEGKLYKNVEEATIALLPDDLQEEVQSSKKELEEVNEELNKLVSTIGVLEAWLDDDDNDGSSLVEQKETDLEVAEAEEKLAKERVSAKEDSYFLLLDSGADAVEANFDMSKVALAKKLEKLLDAVDNNALGAISMFTSATVGLVRGTGVIDEEMQAISQAQRLTNLYGNQKQYLGQRYSRMLVGTLMAVPNIAIGTYKAFAQSSVAGKYQNIVNKVLEAAKADEEAKEEAIKAGKE